MVLNTGLHFQAWGFYESIVYMNAVSVDSDTRSAVPTAATDGTFAPHPDQVYHDTREAPFERRHRGLETAGKEDT